MITIKPQTGHYIVIVTGKNGIRTYAVTKEGCSCGHKQCPHWLAVVAYRKTEAPGPTKDKEVRKVAGIRACPVCDAPVGGWPVWRCSEGGYQHYFEWLNGTVYDGTVEKWMTGDGKREWDRLIAHDDEEEI